jgi:Tat protein secretion system quality control protein TatD with DNase activity
MSISTSSENGLYQTEDEIEALISLSFDAHCHYHLDQSHEANKESERLLRSLAGAALMTMSEEDWGRAKSYVRGAKSTYYSLGVHPWLAHRYAGQEAWLFALRDQLCEEPQATIGEIGLDRKWRTPDTGKVEYEAQLEVFNAQLKLAGELG